MTVTVFEGEVLNLLVATGGQTGVRTQAVSDGWGHAPRQLPGVVSSLVKKRLVWTAPKADGGRTRANSAFIGLTPAGRTAWSGR
jgi:hypothetical protein